MDPAIQSQTYEALVVLQSGFCQKKNKKNACSPFSFTSSGNVSMKRIPGGHYLALKPKHTSAQRISETPELRDGPIAKWYLSTMAFFFFWLGFSISPFPIVNSIIMELSESAESKRMCPDKVASWLPIGLIPLYQHQHKPSIRPALWWV